MALLVLLKLSCSICSMIEGLKENIFIVTNHSVTYFHFHRAESHTSIIFKMSRSSRATKEKEMSDYDRERSLVKVREVSYN